MLQPIKLYRQGDLYLQSTHKIPDTARLQSDLVLSYGEITGHSHRVQHPRSAQLWLEGEELYLEVLQDPARLIHEEHLPLQLKQGTYRVWMQREYLNPDSGAQTEVPADCFCEQDWQGSAASLFQISNIEKRRQAFEQLGFETFIEELRPQVIHADRDAGGHRELLEVKLMNQPVRFLLCHCPSSQKRYLLRVPPTISTTAAAGAWLAGFDNPVTLEMLQES